MRREKGTRAPQPTVPLVLIFVQVFEHRFGKNAIAACSIIYENVRRRMFESPEFYSSWTILAAVYAYSIQIFCDFSGYSDMAIGVAQK